MTRVNRSRWDELPLEKITEMVARKVVASGPVVLTQAYLKKGAVVPLHRHAADVAVYVLQGALRAHVDGEEVTVREGEVLNRSSPRAAPGGESRRHVPDDVL